MITHLGGSAAKEQPVLERIAAAGHAAVSFDPPLHGTRARTSDARAFAAEVLDSFRARMWPILGQATLEAMRVVTWAAERLGRTGPVTAGGVSMGGDIAIALAGIDDRVGRVAAVASTPDWNRPDMHSLSDPTTLIDQGRADRYAQWFADQLDPSRHLERYRRGPVITVQAGGEDRHVPATDVERFQRELGALDPAAAARIDLTVHPGLDHFGVTTDETALASAVATLTG